MKWLNAIGLALGGGLTLCGLVLAAYEAIGAGDGKTARVWNGLKGLGLGLPAPDDPRLAQPTLWLLNTPLWLVASLLGSIVLFWVWLAHATGSSQDEPSPVA